MYRINAWLAERFPAAATGARAELIKDGTLSISCDHPVITQELQLQMPELKRFIAAECPFARIADIRLSLSSDTLGNALAPGNPPA